MLCLEGKIEYFDNSQYIGEYIEDNGNKIRTGKGELILSSKIFGSSKKTCISGNFQKNVLEGQGCISFCSGALYEGEFTQGLQNGFGKYLFPNGSIYEGQWFEGKMHGLGKFTEPDGREIKGHFRNNYYSSAQQNELESEISQNSLTKNISAEVVAFLEETKLKFSNEKTNKKDVAKKLFMPEKYEENFKVFSKKYSLKGDSQTTNDLVEIFKSLDLIHDIEIFIVLELKNLKLFSSDVLNIDNNKKFIFCELVIHNNKKIKGLGLVLLEKELFVIDIFLPD